MKTSRIGSTTPVLRFIGLVAAMATLISGVTFAALQSQNAVIQGNSIQTATAALRLSADGITYADSLSGYSFGALVPGGQPMPITGNPVYIKNGGSSQLYLHLGIGPAFTNANDLDLTKVHIILTPMSGGAGMNFLFSDLAAADATGGLSLPQAPVLMPDNTTGYFMQIQLAPDTVVSAGAALENVNFNFSGTTQQG